MKKYLMETTVGILVEAVAASLLLWLIWSVIWYAVTLDILGAFESM